MKKALLFCGVLLSLSGCGFRTIGTGHMGIHRTWGKIDAEPVAEGLYFYNPFSADMYEYDVHQKTWHEKTQVFTKDTQTVTIQFSAMWAPDPSKVGLLLQTIGGDKVLLVDKVQPIVLASIKDVIGQINADELVSKRSEATKAALKQMQEQLKSVNVIGNDLQFANLDFEAGYEKAVEEKAIAAQQAKKAVNDTRRIDEEAKQIEHTAIANANAMKIKSQALAQNKGLASYEIALKWDGHLPQYMFGSTMPMIDLKNIGKAE